MPTSSSFQHNLKQIQFYIKTYVSLLLNLSKINIHKADGTKKWSL